MRPRSDVTIVDIAKAANVSHSTVSRALRGSTLISREMREKIVKIAREMGYLREPVQRKETAGSGKQILHLSSRGVTSYPGAFSYEIMQGIASELPSDYFITYQQLKDSNAPPAGLDDMSRFSGIIFVYITDDDLNVLPHLMRLNIPLVVINFNTTDLGISCTYADEYTGVSAAVEHLIQLGHTRIAHILGPNGSVSTRIRCSAFLATMSSYGLQVDGDYLVPGEFVPECGYRSAKQLLSLPNRPTAIFTANDDSAMGVYKACMEEGLRIPQDISIVGFDDSEMSPYMTPPLTTIRKDKRLLGKIGAQILLKKIESDAMNTEYRVIDVNHIMRSSCAAVQDP